ncbi:MAG: nitrogen fixation protein [Verrucomicrobia bacterium]|nr:nitrogen fixation protein [Verrucomicrobiota bacterium]
MSSCTTPAGDGIVLCPSAQPDMPGSRILGIVQGTVEQPRVIPLEHPRPVVPELLALTAPVSPTEVFRFTAPCAATGCRHFDGTDCRLAQRIVKMQPAIAETLPICRIRPHCRWWLQEGRAACKRCPGIVTEVVFPDEATRQLAAPY